MSNELLVELEECIEKARSGDENAKEKLSVIAEKLSENESSQVCKITFCNTSEASAWLIGQEDIDVISVECGTKKSLGLMANHTKVLDLILYYRKNPSTPYIYRIKTDEYTHLMSSMSAEHVLSKWKYEHPNYEVIKQIAYRNARGTALELAFDGGPNYVEHVMTLTLFRKYKDGRSINDKRIPQNVNDMPLSGAEKFGILLIIVVAIFFLIVCSIM